MDLNRVENDQTIEILLNSNSSTVVYLCGAVWVFWLSFLVGFVRQVLASGFCWLSLMDKFNQFENPTQIDSLNQRWG